MKSYDAMTDRELDAIRAALPKYTNNCTVEQLRISDEVYAEQTRRYEATIEAYNVAAMLATGLKHGDKVSATFHGWCGCETYTGKVIYNHVHRLSIRTTMADGSGRKTFSINKAWRKD